MRFKKLAVILLAASMTVAGTVSVGATTQDQIENIQSQKSSTESNLAQAQDRIDKLEGLKGNLESYLTELNTQYTELSENLEDLTKQAEKKEKELKTLKAELKEAKRQEVEQYEAMKLRIKYMYENGENSFLVTLLSAESFTDFVNRAENIAQISEYDRKMLKEYEATKKEVTQKKTVVEKEQKEAQRLQEECAQKREEILQLTTSTQEDIAGYNAEISEGESAVSTLLEEVNSQANQLDKLVAKQEAEQQAAEEAQREAQEALKAQQAANEEAQREQETSEQEEPGEIPEESYTEPESDASYEESEVDTDNSQDTGESSSPSGSGTLLGNFKLTAYCNCATCCGVAGNLTASGTVPSAGRTVAMAGVPFGTQLSINGNVYTVEDLGTPYGHVDIFFNSHSDALAFGLQYADVYQLN